MTHSDYISAADLCTLLLDDNSSRKLCVVDVRDDDWSGGNIKGAINIPRHELLDKLDWLHKQLQEKNVEQVVFHCAKSQERGPWSARTFSQFRSTREPLTLRQSPDGSPLHEARVLILEGGFEGFVDHLQRRRNNPICTSAKGGTTQDKFTSEQIQRLVENIQESQWGKFN